MSILTESWARGDMLALRKVPSARYVLLRIHPCGNCVEVGWIDQGDHQPRHVVLPEDRFVHTDDKVDSKQLELWKDIV